MQIETIIRYYNKLIRIIKSKQKIDNTKYKDNTKIDIRNMSNKNDKYSDVLFGPHWFYSVYFVLFGPI